VLCNRIKSRLITTRRKLQEQVIGLDARSAGDADGECMSLLRTCHTMLNMCGPSRRARGRVRAVARPTASSAASFPTLSGVEGQGGGRALLLRARPALSQCPTSSASPACHRRARNSGPAHRDERCVVPALSGVKDQGRC